jgi:hypothetical protein
VSEPDKRVECELHGETSATFVCVHLCGGVGCGFHCAADEPDDAWPDAWCDLCDREWNDGKEPKIQLLCTGCYETVRARNRYVPAPLVPGQLVVTPDEYRELARLACDRCRVRQEATRKAWPQFGASKRWDYDPDAQTITFSDDPASERVVADVTLAGSFSTTTNTWLWAWDNGNYTPEQRSAMDPLRVFGEVRGIDQLRNPHWDAEEVDGFEVTQIAADLLGAKAIYRAPFDHLRVFMLLNGFRTVLPS